MKYMLMMMGTKADFEWYSQWSKEDLEAQFAFMHGLNEELRESGVLVSTEGLAFPEDAKIVRAGSDGEPMTDGVFPESKEFLAGYWIVDVESEARAIEIASRVVAFIGLVGAPPLLIRQVMDGAPEV